MKNAARGAAGFELYKNLGATLVKKGKTLAIKIISDGTFNNEQTFKTQVHKVIGNEDTFEFIGKGERKVKLPIFFDTPDSYDAFIDFVSEGASFILSAPFFPLSEPVKVDGSINLESYYFGAGKAMVTFTNATDPTVDTDSLIYTALASLSSRLGLTTSNKQSFLDSLQNWGKNVGNFVSNTNQTIGNVTNNVAAYSAALNNVITGVASSATIVTNPINSIKSSVSQVVGGLSGALTSLRNAISAIKQIPSDISSFVDTFSALGDQLNNLFNLDNPNDTLRYNTNFLQSAANSIMTADLTANNPAIYGDQENGTSTNPEYYLTAIVTQNTHMVSTLILAGILINLYENAQNINRWNTIDLNKLRTSTEVIYEYISRFDLDNTLRFQLDLARNKFFSIFQILYENALQIISVQVPQPSFLASIVFSVNGNFDYYEETKQLNNIVGGVVSGTILIISNE